MVLNELTLITLKSMRDTTKQQCNIIKENTFILFFLTILKYFAYVVSLSLWPFSCGFTLVFICTFLLRVRHKMQALSYAHGDTK